MTREIEFYEKYFVDFYVSLDSSVQEKIEYVLFHYEEVMLTLHLKYML